MPQKRLSEAWIQTVGPDLARQTRVGGLRGGVLTVWVGNAVLLHELAGFRKRELLEQLRGLLPDMVIADLRFRAGVVNDSNFFSPKGGLSMSAALQQSHQLATEPFRRPHSWTRF